MNRKTGWIIFSVLFIFISNLLAYRFRFPLKEPGSITSLFAELRKLDRKDKPKSNSG